MKAKEKSKEIYCKYADALNVRDLQITANPYAKQCALIAVDEILECYPAQCPKESYEMEQHIYWQQVKTEINNL